MSGVAPNNPDQNPQASQLLMALTGQIPEFDPITGDEVVQPDRLDRNKPDVEEPRRKLVARWAERVKHDKKHHKPAFDRMVENGRFVNGQQWHSSYSQSDKDDPRYVANFALRHVQQRTASLYASNPTVLAKKRDRLLSTVWDGTMASLAMAQQQAAQAAQLQAVQAQAQGVAPPPGQPPAGLSLNAQAILADFQATQDYNKMLMGVCKTLELLWEYNVSEQAFPFKTMMKLTVRRAIVAGVGYVKLGFQRAMQMKPDIETRIADMTERLTTIERISNDIADGELPNDGPEAEELRLSIQALMKEPEIIVREGLLFDYPDSTAIIPHFKCKSLHGFLGADWVTQEYALTPDEIQQIYNVDVCKSYHSYTPDGNPISDRSSSSSGDEDAEGPTAPCAMVWEIYSRKDGLVYVVCDGYPDFLQEPAVPDVYLDRFWPWFPMIMNEGYHDKELFPRSDIDLMKPMQKDINTSRQSLREHRRANRPKMAVAGGLLEPADKEKLENHPANALLEFNALQPGQKITDVLMPIQMPEIDPALYNTDAASEDLMRVLGQDAASTGSTSSTTATDASLAQAAQRTDLSSALDDNDDLLTELATAAGKILMMNVSMQTVTKQIGPGAIWPELSREQIIDNIYLSVQAGSTGRPNRQQDVMNAQIIFPMLQRIPGISPEWMARELIKRMDDRMDLTDAFVESLPSMDALNRIQGSVATPSPTDPVNPIVPPAPGQPGAQPGPLPGGSVAPVPPTQQQGVGSPAANSPRPPPGKPQPRVPAPPAPQDGGGGQAPPTGGMNNPVQQGAEGAQNAPPIQPVNGLTGPRTPPTPGANGLMPGHGGGPKNRKGTLPPVA